MKEKKKLEEWRYIGYLELEVAKWKDKYNSMYNYAKGLEDKAYQNKLTDELITILSNHVGETGRSEGGVEVLERLSNFWNEHHKK